MPRWPIRSLTAALLAGLPPLTPLPASTQEEAGSQLWRLAAATVAVPQALSTGGAAGFWNPAQRMDGARVLLGIEAIQTSQTIDASGVLAALRVSLRGAGSIGAIYGRMQLGGLARTSVSPDLDEGTIPYYTHTLGATWSGSRRGTTLGATVGYHTTTLDAAMTDRWTFDVGADQRVNDVLRIAGATHFFSRLHTSDPGQDLYTAVEYRFYHGPLWERGGVASLRARYGVTFAHGFGADHAFGAGIDLGDPFAFDVMAVREGGFGGTTWRGVGGVRVTIGRYRLMFAGDAGANDLGQSFRVGLEARLR